MLPREQYLPPAGENMARGLSVSYVDGALTREETWSTQCQSDAPRGHTRRVSADNGRTWSEPEPMEERVTAQLPGGGMVSGQGGGQFEPVLGILYEKKLVRLWPGTELFTYDYAANHEHPLNDHTFLVENRERTVMVRYEDGPDFDPDNPFDPEFCATNRAYPGVSLDFAPDGTAFYPAITYKPGAGYSFSGGGVRLMRRDPATGRWEPSNAQFVEPEVSSRGMLEPDVAVLRDGRVLVVCRGSDTPRTPGRKWMTVSADGGRTLPPVEEFRYDDGSSFYSPSSIHRFIRSSRNGRLYWLANIVEEPPRGNSPRYPLYVAEIDEAGPAVRRDSLVMVDDRREGEPEAVQLSNFNVLENRETLDIEICLTRLGENAERFWESGVYRYVFSPPA